MPTKKADTPSPTIDEPNPRALVDSLNAEELEFESPAQGTIG